jgi:hypothetical protein
MSAWNNSTAPQDGRVIVAIGRVIFTDDYSTAVEPFLAKIRWTKREGENEGWHYESGLSVARTLDDIVKVDFWVQPPPTQ